MHIEAVVMIVNVDKVVFGDGSKGYKVNSDDLSAVSDDLKQYEDEEELEKHKAPNEHRIAGSVTAATRRGRATSVPLIEAGCW